MWSRGRINTSQSTLTGRRRLRGRKSISLPAAPTAEMETGVSRKPKGGVSGSAQPFPRPPPAFGEAPIPEQDKHKGATRTPGEGRGEGGKRRSHKICPKPSGRREVEPRASHGAPGVLKTCVLFGRRWPKGTGKTSHLFGSTGTAQRLHHQPRQTILPLRAPRPDLPSALETSQPEQTRVISQGFASF